MNTLKARKKIRNLKPEKTGEGRSQGNRVWA